MEEQSDRLDEQGRRLWSPVAQWESVAGLRLRLESLPREARDMVAAFTRENGFALVAIGERETAVALDAYQRYGKDTGHPAQLNMGNCFACACAKTNDARLLYKVDDFVHTDLR